MPTKNTVKIYLKNGYYHVYNRGVDKREIFLEETDCVQFLHYLKLYLSPPEVLMKAPDISIRRLHKILNLNISNEVILQSFSLMPNHFHLQIKQIKTTGMEKLTRRVLTSYSQFFNRKYKRRGPLFESVYKAVILNTTEQFLYLSSYIHRNPLKLKHTKFDFVNFSSYPYYLGEKHAAWLNPDEILEHFNTVKSNQYFSYKFFVEDFRENPEEVLGHLIIEDIE